MKIAASPRRIRSGAYSSSPPNTLPSIVRLHYEAWTGRFKGGLFLGDEAVAPLSEGLPEGDEVRLFDVDEAREVEPRPVRLDRHLVEPAQAADGFDRLLGRRGVLVPIRAHRGLEPVPLQDP